ncbi:MAG TPA: lysophospholipid acyltransferase family protein [Kofleriaceae bacterium]|nr:lysophospholipid acyltransferase family protein [Kofleriaceae bacterium]
MGLVHSARVVAELAMVTAPSAVELARGRLDRRTIDARVRRFAARVIDILAIDLRITGGAAVSPRETYVYMSNHQSLLDIPVLYAALPSPTVRMLAKAELFRIPIWGAALRAAEFVEVDRRDPMRARVALARAAALVRDGVSIWIAPEGTRSRDGRVGPLKKGGFHVALATGAAIVPVAIRGTIDILPRGAGAAVPGRRVDVHIGDPIPVAGRTVADLRDQVAGFLATHVERAS